MDILDSEWLIKMLEKSSKSPQQRMLNLFDVLSDWIRAPKIEVAEAHPSIGSPIKPTVANRALIEFFTAQAKACGAEHPSMLAEHLVLIARNAAEQTLHQPDSNSLLHAKKVAVALIASQTQRNWLSAISHKSLNSLSLRPFTYGVAASLMLTLIAAGIWLPELINKPSKLASVENAKAKLTQVSLNTTVELAVKNNQLTAHDAAKMYSKYEEMRNGTCQFPEALQIPDKDKAIYLENVVGGKLPNNLDDLAIAISYLEKVRCNFMPMLMAHST